MLESVQGMARGFFGQDSEDRTPVDGRKHEYGDLEYMKAQRRKRMADRSSSARAHLMREVNGNESGEVLLNTVRNRNRGGVKKSVNGERRKGRMYQEKVEREMLAGRIARNQRNPGTLTKILSAIKTIFSPEAENMGRMKRVSESLDQLLPESNRISDSARCSQMEERRRMRERIGRSEAFKRKLLEKRNDEALLDQLKRGRPSYRQNDDIDRENETIDAEFSSDAKNDISRRDYNRKVKSRNLNIVDDQVFLLQKKVDSLESKLNIVEKELYLSKKKLKFAKEKNSLLESLLDDANIDSEYVKSRRDIKNLQKENLIPEADLPPSPRRTVNPLFTSSPMRKVSGSTKKNEEEVGKPTTSEFYNKYPKIPETEKLKQDIRERSLSPINIDYSKYSSPR
ncbi:hypothetical protein TPHA_0I03210 [Tetrapisispora phaffii CBS 4417]|uniref:Uncharacterized protein n=1 Tax=Tetrapisispora phaffii (strain ATCC 24235 / CBS 4417 / NBRC 1672 / NRRL Y-8282 / UCD 70-5) TaxID=1071381 RepID=G8BY44_TETPH|nr:hypothetical protein TPHA_0I03210 [Tetrapisispora phaffii CBS 4417]CCE64822.1 hypothetical protein TPHA_0I03210 [Tetrapisispora phaffii CBS 4417]